MNDDKENFNLKEVSEIVEIPPHIIRYWETEFLQVKPERDELRQRIYSRKDLDVIIRIRYLLFEEKYSIADTKIELAKEFD
jgi:DNA-binding transcriptional MerR regulator